MTLPFLYHLLITTIIFYIIATWFKFFLKLRLTIDFSYVAIVIFASYVTALLNIHLGWWMLSTIGIGWIGTIVFTLLILFLSRRLSQVYFIVGTLALYMFFFQISLNRESVTSGTFWLSGIQRILVGDIKILGLENFLIVAALIWAIVLIGLAYFKRTYLFALLKWWGENDTVLKVLGVKVSLYTLIMILITSLCAVVGANLYTFYYMYIDPWSFWLSLLVLVLVISFISYKWGELRTFITALFVIFGYEYLRFFKVVDPSKLGYLREMIFALIIMITAFITFRKTSFGRDQ